MTSKRKEPVEMTDAEVPEDLPPDSDTAHVSPIAEREQLTVARVREIIQDSNLNFLIGAGASSAFFSLLGDTEKLLTKLNESDANPNVVKRAVGSVYAHFFESVIAGNAQLIAGDDQAEELLSSYSVLLQSVNTLLLRRRSSIINKRANLFTTNVDVAIELAAERLQVELNDGFSGRFKPIFDSGSFGSVKSRRSLQYDNLSEIPTFDLLKLHGSVGWTNAAPSGTEAQSKIYLDPTLAVFMEIEAALEKARPSLLAITAESDASTLLGEAELEAEELANLDAFVGAYEQLLIVNPTKQKFGTTVLDQVYYDQLRTFSNELEKENTVLFTIGFSCRDEHIRDLILRAARTNPTLQVVAFAYDSSEIEKMETRLESALAPNSNVLVVGPPPSPEGEPEGAFSVRTITETFFDPIYRTASNDPAAAEPETEDAHGDNQDAE